MTAHYAPLTPDDDDTKATVSSSPDTSTPTSTTPDHIHYASLADHTFTPLSLVDDSFAPASSPVAAKVTVDAPSVGGACGSGGATGMHDGSHLGSPSTSAMAPGEAPAPQGLSRPDSGKLCLPESLSEPKRLEAPLDDRGHRSSDTSTHSSVQGSPSLNFNNISEIPANPDFADDPLPLRTGSVRADTRLAHPKPINLTTSSSSGSITEPPSDLSSRLGAPVGNVAQLEATAEQLSMTSSIDHAIRDLHGELKRSDSRRSSILAANIRSVSGDEYGVPPSVALQRGLSSTSSIVPTNTAARQGGYSPAGFVMSPTNSLTGRLRSGSKNSTGRPDIETESVLLRHGPGKTSVTSVRSTKMSLAEISESEPVALDQAALDQADAAPPIENEPDETIRFAGDNKPSTDAFHNMLGDGSMEFGGPVDLGFGPADDGKRPSSSHSDNTLQQAKDAFVDFDGVHWEPNAELDAIIEDIPPPRIHARIEQHRQSYIDPMTGQQMMWYPARVPAMLNLPPKLSANKPRAANRDSRRAHVLSTMAQSDYHGLADNKNRPPAAFDLNSGSKMPNRDSWLPDPLAGQRESFIGLDSDHFRDPEAQSPQDEVAVAQDQHSDIPADQLRRPPRLSRMAEQRDSSMPKAEAIPPQLRASAFFDLPSAAPQIEVKDGSAMATLDSILDAGAVAPVSAFTDHVIAGKLGSEVYGKEKKRKAHATSATPQQLAPPSELKKGGSFMWLNKRKSSHGSTEKAGTASNDGSNSDNEDERSQLTKSIDGHSVIRVPAAIEDDSEEEDEEDEIGYQGPPTTLLAELQIRKQHQKQRTQPLTRAFPNGMHATLLEMDAVAEAQRKERKGKRVNLAWEDPDAHYDQNGSDDEDVPLAIIAAKQQGAKNMADVERPIGLMERRELEENEPLSQRRARLQGLGTQSLAQLQQRQQSMLSLAPVPRPGGSRAPSRAGLTPEPDVDLQPDVPEVEGETLGERKRRLAAKEEAEGRLPSTRPVSRAFSDELLGRFGPEPEPEETSTTPPVNAGEETLGQRRKRLQAEREARDREMSYGNLVGQPLGKRNSRLSMSDVLNAYPKKEGETATMPPQQQRAALPQTLSSQIVSRQGAFMGGVYNTGGLRTMQSTPSFHTQGMAYGAAPPSAMGGYGFQMPQQAGYNGFSPMGGYNAMGAFAPAPAMSMYGGNMMQPRMPGQMQMQMQMPLKGGSMDRVEQWRQGIL
ncbi:hypothetical protein NLU13_8363 [Sarocladium strictum]|uniref:Uncharacterized protein n=1 Tax=Sarocladium strictum TaxID=5046 RepID=A0AA39L527_SARSR|nr:hypothetical protein NLU13_8363 [Sarocladium strictum]